MQPHAHLTETFFERLLAHEPFFVQLSDDIFSSNELVYHPTVFPARLEVAPVIEKAIVDFPAGSTDVFAFPPTFWHRSISWGNRLSSLSLTIHVRPHLMTRKLAAQFQ